jgi:hypothetical protein
MMGNGYGRFLAYAVAKEKKVSGLALKKTRHLGYTLQARFIVIMRRILQRPSLRGAAPMAGIRST